MSTRQVAGPYLDELEVGERFTAPGLTLTPGHAALHQAIAGDRLLLALDGALSHSVTGDSRPLAHPQLVCDVSIGQSTVATQRVLANLYYRGLVLRRAVHIGDTLRTTTTVVGRKRNRRDPATGLVLLRIDTTDQHGQAVLSYHRCAMLPVRQDVEGELPEVSEDLPSAAELSVPTDGWDLAPVAALPGPHFADLAVGDRWTLAHGDVVTAAPELARLTLNLAAAHHTSEPRLVYGGHTIGLACAQLCRALPNLVTLVAWRRCDHLRPVHEGDRLHSTVAVEAVEPAGAGGLAHLHVRTESERGIVLDWWPVGLLA